MDFTISSSLLYKHLAGASRIVAGKSTMPILESALFTVESDQLKMLVTDLETTLLTRIPLENVRREGSIGVPLRILLDTLKEFPDMPLNFTVDANSKIQVTYNVGTRKGEFSVIGQNTDDFPEVPKLQEETSEFTTSTEVFLAGISHTAFAAGKTDLAPALAGVLIEVKPEHLRFVATDHNRVACATRKDVHGSEGTKPVFLPIRPAGLLNSILPHDDEELHVTFDSHNMRLSTQTMQLICRLTETNFPPYESVIPYENPFELTIDRVVFHNALKQVSPFSDRGRNMVTLELERNLLKISAKNAETQNEAYQEIECSYEGDPLSVSFNTLHLTEALANIAAQEVMINFSPNTRSSLLRPTIDESENDELLMVVAQAHR